MKALSLPLLALLVGGCVVQGPPDNGPAAAGGNVNVLWTFSDGSTCATLGGQVDHIQVDIPGQKLENGGAYSCNVAGTQGIELADFAPGTYSISVTAVASATYGSNALYAWSGSFTVNGDIEVDATLTPVTPAQQPGNVTLIWSFTDGSTCSTAGSLVNGIQVTISGQTLQNGGAFPCDLAGTMGVELDNFAPGDYSYMVAAVEASGNALYSYSGTFTVNGNITVDVPLAPASNAGTATADLGWTFVDSSGAVHSCSSVGVDTIAVTFSGLGTTTFPCVASNGTQGTDFANLSTGSYTLTVAGLSNGTQTYGLSEGVVIAAGTNTINLPMSSD